MNTNNFSWISILSCVISILGIVLYGAIFSDRALIPIFVIVSLLSLVLPLISKKLRLTAQKKGKFFEIVAIIIGGFNFYCIIFALTKAPIYIAYLGWLVCGVIYKFIKIEENTPVKSNEQISYYKECGTELEKNKNYVVCIYDAVTHTLRKEMRNVDIRKFPPSKFADNDTYYAIETFRDKKKVRVYYTKDSWNKQIETDMTEKGN